MKIQYRFLSDANFTAVYETNLAAFSDYVIPFQITEKQFINHIAQNNIKLDLSVGAFDDGRLIGYTLNGIGEWNGKKTAYNGGTGVIPDYRRNGVGQKMFEFLVRKLRKIGVKQMLLEVISSNTKAINLYRKLGFLETRRLLFFEQTNEIKSEAKNTFEIRQVEDLDWNQVQTFWDKETSWQFSIDSIKRRLSTKVFFSVVSNDKLIGYSIFYPSSGIIPQIAVDKQFRGQNVATILLAEMQKHLEENKKLRFTNIDRELASLIRFAGKLNFTPSISQFEMMLEL